MKRFTQIVCILLVFAMLMPFSVMAAENGASRASNYFWSSSVYFWKVSGSSYQIWFDVTAVGTMAKLGTSYILVERSTDLVNWESVRTYDMANYSQMTDSNVARHVDCVPFTATSGYAYRAIVTLYAKNSSGTGEMDATTPLLDLR